MASYTQSFRAAALSLALGVAGSTVSADDTYYHQKDITVGGTAGTPSLFLDAAGRRLYLTHSSRVEVINLDTGAASFIDSPSAHSFVVAPKLNRGFVSDSRSGAISVIDLATMKSTASVKTAAGAAALAYDPDHEAVYVFNARTPSVTIFDAGSGKEIKNLPLNGKPGLAVVDAKAGHVYCTLMDENRIAVLDTRSVPPAKPWPVSPGKQPAALAVNPANHHVFVACRNKQLVTLDGGDGKVIASAPVGTGADGAAYDPATHLVFCANSDGTATILREEGADKLTVAQTLVTERNARIIALDPETHRIYLTTTDFAAQLPPEDGSSAGRPHTLRDSLKILVYGTAGQ